MIWSINRSTPITRSRKEKKKTSRTWSPSGRLARSNTHLFNLFFGSYIGTKTPGGHLIILVHKWPRSPPPSRPPTMTRSPTRRRPSVNGVDRRVRRPPKRRVARSRAPARIVAPPRAIYLRCAAAPPLELFPLASCEAGFVRRAGPPARGGSPSSSRSRVLRPPHSAGPARLTNPASQDASGNSSRGGAGEPPSHSGCVSCAGTQMRLTCSFGTA